MALEGFDVVGIDYTGLGVHSNGTPGQNITNQAQVNAAGANDLFYAIEAAQTAFSTLSKSFVISSHSLGGGVAWAAAERQVSKPVSGYLGAAAGSPLTNSTGLAIATQSQSFSGISVADSVKSIFPNFNTSVLLTPAGHNLLTLAKDIQACNSATLELLEAALANKTVLSPPSWVSDPTIIAWQNIAAVGGKNATGPLLILQGVNDTTVPEAVTAVAVNATTTAFPSADIEYLRFEGVDHVPVMYASQRIWLGWIEDRFKGKTAKSGYSTTTYGQGTAPMPLSVYQGDLNYFLEYSTAEYETA
jgi:alpha-beta hydrolase superfamily lysophospholipase